MNGRLTNFQVKPIEVNLVLNTAAYASGDVLSDRVALQLISGDPLGSIRGEVVSVTLLDKDAEGGLLDLVFLDADVTLGTVNDAVSISDANAERVLAVVPVLSYDDLGGCKVARPSFDPIPFEVTKKNLYVGAVSRDTKTYTAASDIRLKVFVRLHNLEQ